MGRSFSQYLNDYRINIALDMLHNAKYYDVNYIASFVGYQNHGISIDYLNNKLG